MAQKRLSVVRGVPRGWAWRLGLSALACLPWAPPNSASAVVFTNATASAGITHVHTIQGVPQDPARTLFYTGGAAASDFDGDGLVDLVFTRINEPNILYRNQGDGTFEARTTAAGFTTPTAANGVVSGDVDNDGDLDLYTTTVGATRNYLYLNDGSGYFTDVGVAEPAALSNTRVRSGQGASFGDYDNDGYLDLATGDWGNLAANSQSRLLHNRGALAPGSFTDVTVAAGINVYRSAYSFRFAPRFTDLDRDGRIDLTFAADFETSQLFWNNGGGAFTDGTLAAGVGTDPNGMGTTFGDYDGDGDLDWFITATTNAPGIPGPHGGGNRLYRNEGNRTFTDVTLAAGVYDARWAWGTTFFDYDNDGDVDLAATNGYNGAGWVNDQTYLWRNDDGQFTDVSTAAGIVDTDQGRGLLHLDYDADGDVDLLVVNNEGAPVLYRNDGGNENHYLRIRTRGTISNRDGIGAWITVTPDLNDPERQLVWEIDGGSSFISQNERTAHFGLGSQVDPVDRVTIAWPSGVTQSLYDVAVDQTLVVNETAFPPADFDADGDVDGADLGMWMSCFGESAQGDADGDGTSIGSDFLAWQRMFGDALVSGVPEPSAGVTFLLAAVGLAISRRARPARAAD
ncbi:MAG: hypothetical protein DCC67_04340 [Planctomycetota bacterium]|nr:MAG: hypothetical protein DCC67_04340 [Planctomycetota bacterium]